MRGEAGNFVTQTFGWNGGHLLSSDFPQCSATEKNVSNLTFHYTEYWLFDKDPYLVGGWTNLFEKYSSNWKPSPSRGEHKYLKPPTSYNGILNVIPTELDTG